MTIASIDALGETMPLDATAIPASASVIPAETVAAFQQALSGPLTENENLGRVLREAMVSVGETQVRVDVAALKGTTAARGESPVVVDGTEAVSPVVSQPLPAQVAENVKLGETLTAATVSVGETLAKVKTVVVKTATVRSDAGVDASVAVAPAVVQSVTPVLERVVVQPIEMQPAELVVAQNLSGQVTENVKLGEALTAATVVVGETLAKVETAVTQTTTVRPDAGVEAPVVVAPTVVTPVAQRLESVTMQPLPAQVAENVKLGETLTATTGVVGETLAKVDVAVMDGAPAVRVAPLSEQVKTNAELGVSLAAAAAAVGETQAKVGVAALDGSPAVRIAPLSEQVKTNAELGASLAAAATAVGEAQADVDVAAMGGAKSTAPASVPAASEDDAATVPAEAPVAAGVTSPASVQTSAAPEAPQTAPAVAPVDVVRVQAATAAEAVPSQVLVQAAEAVADTLLVSPGLLRGQGEVLVKLRPDVLDGTEVKISVTGRQLDVVFQPQTVDMAVMIENCRTQLVQHLANKIVSFNVTVDVRKKRVEG